MNAKLTLVAAALVTATAAWAMPGQRVSEKVKHQRCSAVERREAPAPRAAQWQLAPADKVPTPLTPVMEYNGVSVEHNELGGLKSTYRLEPTETLPAGTVVTLKPQLPQGTADTGNWRWNTGETSKDITIVADRSGVWRATYTNENGVESEQVFTIAVEGDCEECTLRPNVTYNGTTREASTVNAFYGSEVGLSITPTDGWGFYEWETGSTASSITLPHVTTSRDVAVIFTGQGGRRQKLTFHINVQYIRPDIVVNGGTHTDTPMIIVEEGDDVTLTATPADGKDGGTYRWSDGSTGEALALGQVTTSGTYTLEYTVEGVTSVLDYQVYVKADGYATIPAGDYYIRHLTYGTYLTNPGDGQAPSFQPQREGNPAQQWRVENTPPSTTYGFQSLLDQAYLKDDGSWQTGSTKPFRLSGAVGVDEVAIQKSARTGNIFWQVDEDGRINFTATAQPTAYPFEFIPVEGSSIGAYIGTIAVAYIPVAFVVFAEHLADHKNISSIIESDLLVDPGLSRTLLGDGVGSIAGAFFGGCPNTTYGESVGCVAISGNASVATTFVTAIFAILCSFIGVFTTFLDTIPSCVMGGVCIALYGFIAVSGLKMLQKVDLNENGNLFTASVVLIAGVGGMALKFGAVTVTAIACALILGILTNLVVNVGRKKKEDRQAEPAADAAAPAADASPAQAEPSETKEEYVVYRQLYGDNSLWLREKNMFLSKVDFKKYPDAKQQYRFELTDLTELNYLKYKNFS